MTLEKLCLFEPLAKIEYDGTSQRAIVLVIALTSDLIRKGRVLGALDYD